MKQYKKDFGGAIGRTAHKRYFRDKQMIRPDDNPEIRLISADYKKNDIYGTLDLSKNEISKDLNDRLVSIFKNVKMRNRLLPAVKSHTVSEGDTHITVSVSVQGTTRLIAG